jgi:hypothetical protein
VGNRRPHSEDEDEVNPYFVILSPGTFVYALAYSLDELHASHVSLQLPIKTTKSIQISECKGKR